MTYLSAKSFLGWECHSKMQKQCPLMKWIINFLNTIGVSDKAFLGLVGLTKPSHDLEMVCR